MNPFFLLFQLQKKTEGMIDVCCAILVNDHKIMAVQRGSESSHPMKWEFPGGKINSGETDEQCIVRELYEELQVQVVILKKLESIEFQYTGKLIELIPFVCRVVSGELVLTEHIAERWFNPDDWQSLDWAEADRELILKNRKELQQIVG